MPDIKIPIETLITDLHGPDWEKRCDAARLLGQSGDARAVEALLPDLQDPDWRVRRNAVQALGALKTPQAVEPLLQALNDRTNTVRQRAAVALGRIKDPETIPTLIQVMLENQSSNVSEAAYQALRKFGRKAGPMVLKALEEHPNAYLIDVLAEIKVGGRTELLIELADHTNPQIQRKAITALGKTKDSAATHFLTSMLDCADSGIQALAIQSLGQLGATEAIPRMLGLLQEDALYGPNSGMYHAIADAFQQLSGIKGELENAFPAKFPSLLSITSSAASLPEAISTLGDEHFQKLNDMLANMEARMEEMGMLLNLPREAVEGFSERTWRFGALFADARDARAERIKTLLELLASESALKRTAAALTLPWYTDIRGIGPLEEAMHDADETVRRAATWAHAALKTTLQYKQGSDSIS
jgi:HEAT repeat protein